MPEDTDSSARAIVLDRKLRALKRHIFGLCENIDIDSLSGCEISIFEAKLNTSRSHWLEFQKAWDERFDLQPFIDGDDFPSKEMNALYDKLKDEITLAEGMLLAANRRENSSKFLQNESQFNRSQLNVTSNTSSKAHLPRIEIPQFSGDILKWTHFRDTFLSMIHNDPNLTDIERFHYLVGALKGEAAALLSRFPVEERSYKQAWDKVFQTYNNPRVLASMLINRIVDCNIKGARNEIQRYDEFLTGVADSIEAFRSLNLDDPCEFLLSALALRALDSETRKNFELSLNSSNKFPSTDDVINFVRQRKTALQMSQETQYSTMSTSSSRPLRNNFPNRNSSKYNAVSLHSSSDAPERSPSNSNNDKQYELQKSSSPSPTCYHCKGCHRVTQCEKFSSLPSPQRINLIRSWKVCWNCLSKGHKTKACKSKFKCKHCKRWHHTLLHEECNKDKPNTPAEVKATNSQETFIGFGSTPSLPSNGLVLLGTVRLLVKGHLGELVSARAVLDSGSQHSFVTHSFANRLNVEVSPFCGNITSLGESTVPKSQLKGSINCIIRSYQGGQEYKLNPIIVDKITSSLPSRTIPHSISSRLMHHPLADHHFGEPGNIDLLIGGDLYHSIITGAPVDSGVEELFLIPTVFGLVVAGKIENVNSDTSCSFFTELKKDVESQLKAFWEIEEPIPVSRIDPKDQYCEKHFVETHYRKPDGRYVVRLPFDPESDSIGNNRGAAFRRFYSLEHKFRKDQKLAQEYGKFMRDYEDLGHMSLANSESSYIIPHHGVWQDGPKGTKLRVVFDASCQSSSMSLNDILLSGPKLLEDICQILFRFRLYLIPICADLIKMYRQIEVHHEDRKFQHIIWRDNPTMAVKEMELNTVTQGVKSSSFHALRVIKQLLTDEGSQYPLAASRIQREMFADDIVTGANSFQEGKELIQELVSLFAKGGFSLSKWASSVTDLIPANEDTVDYISVRPEGEDSVKVLGLIWSSSNDAFTYAVTPLPAANITKRAMLSAVARLYDPLGLVSPVIILAKALIQDVWKANIGWDEILPCEITRKWMALSTTWNTMSEISIPRYISIIGATHRLVGFCDASSKAYGATLYIHCECPDGRTKVSLVKAKTKVAPLKFTSIPRLELCGALLLSRLMESIPQDNMLDPVCFTDSQVVMAWLNTPTHLLPVFEANRVSQILNRLKINNWHHVKSEDNPADMASRGCLPSELKNNYLWWNGPIWLQRPAREWLKPAESSIIMNLVASNKKPATPYDWTSKISTFIVLVRTVARIIRLFLKESFSSPITAKEFQEAELRCIYFVQRLYFPKQLFSDSSQQPKEFSQLCPFLDQRGVLRVGGRLDEAPLSTSAKQPILIPANSPFAKLIIRHVHENHFHAGPTLTLALLRQKYWIPRAAKLIRSCIHGCVSCRIRKAKPITPIMAPLPKDRFQQFKAFVNVGVDYAGPFLIKESSRRNAALGKAYLCLFVCLSSKALHLELVTSLSTSSFLSALDRFMSRRGAPKIIWSDHGTNFVGASRYLKDVFIFLRKHESEFSDGLAHKGIDWKFIPPRAPHFGGLWEAGVKSVKGLLASTIGKHPLTFEELSTALIKIEGLLNSRPLCSLNEDANNFDFLTPGHFLNGAPLSLVPEPSDCARTFSSKWRVVQSQISHVWNRWRREYLNSLMQRSKWNRKTTNIKVGDLVILIEKRSLLGQWPVARVIEAYPGRDGVTRAVLVRNPAGTCLTRAVTSLVPLFPSSEENL